MSIPPALSVWIEELKKQCRPKDVHICDGSEAEYNRLCEEMVQSGVFTKLNPDKHPNCFLARSDPADVARVEDRTFICCSKKEEAGPTNNWADPTEMKAKLNHLFDGCMEGRTMFVIPYCMGPVDSPFAKLGVEITDSAYVVVNMHIMTRVGPAVLKKMEHTDFLKCLHSVGYPLPAGKKDLPWPCNKENKYICHFPEDPSVMSFGSGYGGNALLGKKCYALRIASTMGRKEGWMSEHCLILGLTSPEGKTQYVAAAFPSACGKTNLAMLVPTIPGWKVRTVGDDIAWMRIGPDGRLWAINPESGFFGVAPGTSDFTNKSAMEAIHSDSIFTNVGLTPDGDVWWEGMTEVPPPKLIDWTNQEWTPACGRKAAHPNARYTCRAHHCPVIDPAWEDPKGVPLSAIIFGGRRSTTVPLVNESFDWPHGVFMGSVCSSEQTAAAEGKVGTLRLDPFAMLPFCGYNMGDYFQHWLDMGAKLGSKAPKIFYVNWFRKDSAGHFMWPGYSDNSRVLKWICGRVDGTAPYQDTPIGRIPTAHALDLAGLDLPEATVRELLAVDTAAWLADIPQYEAHFAKFGDRLPPVLAQALQQLECRLKSA